MSIILVNIGRSEYTAPCIHPKKNKGSLVGMNYVITVIWICILKFVCIMALIMLNGILESFLKDTHGLDLLVEIPL